MEEVGGGVGLGEHNGLNADSAGQCQHIRSISTERVDSVRGNVGASTLSEIRRSPEPDSRYHLIASRREPLSVGRLWSKKSGNVCVASCDHHSRRGSRGSENLFDTGGGSVVTTGDAVP